MFDTGVEREIGEPNWDKAGLKRRRTEARRGSHDNGSFSECESFLARGIKKILKPNNSFINQ